MQSEYFDVAKVSLYITILYCYAVESVDGKTSTEDDPQIVKEHLFVISDDVQDYHAVHKAQELITGYLENQLHMKISKFHEFTWVCFPVRVSSLSKICLAVVATMDSWCKEIFFKSSPTKGEQDAAGAYVKQKVSHAMRRKTAVIRNAKDMKEYLEENYSTSAASTFALRSKAVGLERRLFFYVPPEGDEAVVGRRQKRAFKNG